MLQRRGAQFVLIEYQRNIGITRLLYTLSWPSLKTRRSYLKISSTYKILITIPSDNFRPVNYNTRGH